MALLHFGAIAPNVASLQTSVVAPRSVATWHKKLKKLPNVRNKDPKLPKMNICQIFHLLIRVLVKMSTLYIK